MNEGKSNQEWGFCCQYPPTPTSSLWFVWFHPFAVLPLVLPSAVLPALCLSCLGFLCPLLAWWLLTLSDFSLHFQLLLSQSMATPNHCSLQPPPALPNPLIQESLSGAGICFTKDLVEAPQAQRGGTIYQ